MSRTLSKKLASIKSGTLFVGVDLAQDCNVAVVIDQNAKQLARFSFSHTREGYDRFYQRLEKLCDKHSASSVLIGMEPTNYYWKLLAADLEDHQLEYRLVNPYTVKKSREGEQLDRSKDDNRDAFTIADLLRTGKFTETQLLHEQYAELRQLVRTYQQLQKDRKRAVNVIDGLVDQLFPGLTKVFKDLTAPTARALLTEHAAAVKVRALSEDVFITEVQANFSGKRLARAKLRQAYQLAATCPALKDGHEAFQLSLNLHLEIVQLLDDQLEEVCKAIENTFQDLPEATYLLSVPGLGLLSAATILAEIGDSSHYSQASQWVKLAGIQPVPNLSGHKSRSKTPMSHKGRRHLRTALYFAVMRLLQRDDYFMKQYQRFQTRQKNPLTKMQAIGALMNKLLRILWALISKKTCYCPDFQKVA